VFGKYDTNKEQCTCSLLSIDISLAITVNILTKTEGLHWLDITERLFTRVRQNLKRICLPGQIIAWSNHTEVVGMMIDKPVENHYPLTPEPPSYKTRLQSY